ncbi:LysE/ArgO family amino acid transporter [Pelagibaculum spongiae]|uniref:Amino acid transporter n=1 Tax=Pelagibaculum spongiae TaxID=2080658 RepID=A0A2V1GYG7_9GAMM|nr:LysE/ArgO family amino acid transporter [Pelagibaculum spongiae]PVZ66803.1 amino acid transporter [Pelagibaculum spongiae]
MTAWLAGFSLGLSLILAIGAQNAFVLKHGLVKRHVFIICLVCAVSDAILIALGVSGFGLMVKQFPTIEQIARYGGALFLLVYALMSFKSAIQLSHQLKSEDQVVGSATKTVMVCLAFTWLNPHVYLDTVVLLGSISTQYEGAKLLFATGAMTASFVFFFSLGYGARLLKPIFDLPNAWKVFEALIGVVMLLIAWSLLAS